MNKRGFTLIELLAVIVILAIIALIAVPIVLNMIENARKSAAKSSTYGYIQAIDDNNELYEMNDDYGLTIEEIKGTNIPVSSINLNIKGKKPTSGTVTIDEKGRVSNATLCINNYTVTYNGTEAAVGSKGCEGGSSVSYKCKKATTLTSETCSYACQSNGISGGSKIEYGTLVSGNTLETGNALDCNVDGSGYNKRFYYLTDLKENSDYAVLIYNNNTRMMNNELLDDNSVKFAYNLANENWNGPVTAKDQLPSTVQWNNIKLSSTTRKIEGLTRNTYGQNTYTTTTNNGEYTLPNDFSYSGKAARLLTFEEMYTACNLTPTFNNGTYPLVSFGCSFLVEHTQYANGSSSLGYWLETPSADSGDSVYVINGPSARTSQSKPNDINYFGVRPVIEVKKSEIDLN